VIGTGVNPMITKARVSQPSAILAAPSGTWSLTVGGWRGPENNNKATISP
jgi:hypothetical protein